MEMLKSFSLYLIVLKGMESGHFQQILQQKFDFVHIKYMTEGNQWEVQTIFMHEHAKKYTSQKLFAITIFFNLWLAGL